MSYNVAHINVHDKDGHFHQIFQVKGVLNFKPSKKEKEQAKKLVETTFPYYKRAELVVMHYDKNDYNDKKQCSRIIMDKKPSCLNCKWRHIYGTNHLWLCTKTMRERTSVKYKCKHYEYELD